MRLLTCLTAMLGGRILVMESAPEDPMPQLEDTSARVGRRVVMGGVEGALSSSPVIMSCAVWSMLPWVARDSMICLNSVDGLPAHLQARYC